MHLIFRSNESATKKKQELNEAGAKFEKPNRAEGSSSIAANKCRTYQNTPVIAMIPPRWKLEKRNGKHPPPLFGLDNSKEKKNSLAEKHQ